MATCCLQARQTAGREPTLSRKSRTATTLGVAGPLPFQDVFSPSDGVVAVEIVCPVDVCARRRSWAERIRALRKLGEV
jgi:hypothetical protein